MQRDGFSVDAAIEKGRKLPDWYEDEPALYEPEFFYLQAFNELNTERLNTGFGIGEIPNSKIKEYGRDEGLSEEMCKTLVIIIRIMDQAFRKWHEPKKD